ncbi:MAG: Fur family transcriptional regulator [Desulfomonilaceae bacterium]
MTQDQSHQSPEEEFRLFRIVCKEQRIKVTPQRLEIFRAVIAAQDHPSAEDVYNRVKNRLPAISLDTVYRTLATFESGGIISRVWFCEDKTRFDPNCKPHHHLFCTVCKSLTDFYWANFDDADLPPEIPEWGCPETKHVQIRGICSHCSRERNKP